MANELDELTGPVSEKGNDINVIYKQIPVKVGWGSTFFQVMLWVLGIIPGLIFLGLKIKAGNYLSRLQQKIQHNASQIDNYLEQRVVILENTAALVNKATKLDESTFQAIAAALSLREPPARAWAIAWNVSASNLVALLTKAAVFSKMTTLCSK